MSHWSFPRAAVGITAAAFVCCVLAFAGQPAAAATAAGTQISNTASATYTDTNGIQYSTQSNTVVVTVQSAPNLTVSTNNGALAGTNTGVPNSCFVDIYTLTNTGNGPGYFQVTNAAPAFGSNDSASAGFTNFTISVNGGANQVFANPNALANMNAYLNAATGKVQPGQVVTITINYCNSNPANVPGLITTTVVATITQKAADIPGTVDTTSGSQTNTYNDSIIAEARLDLQKTAVVSGTGAAPVVTYTINANNGGGAPARVLTSLNTGGFGFASAGILIADKIPAFGGVTLTLTATTPTCTGTGGTNGFPAGATATVYYTTDPTGGTGWTNVKPASPLWVGCFVVPSSGTIALNSNPGTSAGNVPGGSAAVVLTFAVNGPTGPGSGNPCAGLVGPVTNIANSVIGGNATPPAVTTPPQIIGPTITTLVSDNGNAAAVTAIKNALQNATSLQGPSGASNGTCSQMPANRAVLNGPRTAPGAIGSYDGNVAVTNDNDFTDVGFTPNGFIIINSSTTVGSPTGNNMTAVAGINVSSDIQNAGNIDDSYTIVATAPASPAGWTVQLFNDNGSGAPNLASPLCTPAAATCTAASIAVASGATLHYWAVYASPNNTPSLVRYDGNTLATSVADGTIHNQTHHELYAGFVALTKSTNIVTNCSGVVPALGVCPGGTITYIVDYRSIVTFPGTGNTEPAAAILVTKAGQLAVSDDGALAPNNWSTFTNGINVPGASDTTAGTTFVYSGGTGVIPGAFKVVATIGGGAFQLQPASGSGSPNVCTNAGLCSGQTSFAVTVK
ncbi:MAG: hypothetical protein JO293_05970 [Candidatus Eremiobacteraeota bacterium]|nr:hypothetical protein [Candidatus Eremiobacteraeota bacterium]